ncbi:outer dense fiber protein 2 isoform X1 [Hydra vulgaris]|nr:outer dense fiber protein 2-like isoform X1 [Hydra vulgaris]
MSMKVKNASSKTKKKVLTTTKGPAEKNPKFVKKAPFIPPPGKTSPSKSLAWESSSHRLEIVPPLSKNKSHTMVINDLSHSEDEIESKHQYDMRINRLLADVSFDEIKTGEQLNASRRLIEDQEEEIKAYKKDLNLTTHDFAKARRSLELLSKEVELSKNEADLLNEEKKALLKKLRQVENEGQEAALEALKWRDACKKLKKDQKNSSTDYYGISQQRNALLEKLAELEESNQSLRSLLKQAQRRMDDDQKNIDKCEILMRKLVEAEAKIQEQSAQLSEQDQQIDSLLSQIKADKHHALAFSDLQKTMETTRSHLQNSLRTKESEVSNLTAQFKNLEDRYNQSLLELEHYQGLLAATRDKALKDKENFKKAAHSQRERAYKNEEENKQLHEDISNAVSELESAKVTLEQLTKINCELKNERNNLYDEVQSFKKSILDLGNIMELSSKSIHSGPTYVLKKLHSKMTKMKSIKAENEKLKVVLKDLEARVKASEKSDSKKLYLAESELKQLQDAVNQYEILANEYKSQLENSNVEIGILNRKIESMEREHKQKLHETMNDINEMQNVLHNKTLEMASYPELLKASEIRYQNAQERALSAENKITEHTRLITELTFKIESHTEQLERLRNKYNSKHDQCKVMSEELHIFKRKMQDNEVSHRELLMSISRKDESIRSLQESLEEQKINNERIIQQLEVALSDSKRQLEIQKEKTLAKERSAQARIMDLEAQLMRSSQNTELLKRTKEEAERKFNSRLQDMRDRLEQANSTTKSMQTYVQFLKSTYANVFSDDIPSDFNEI